MKVSDTVHAHLRGAILSGELAPGGAIPSERELSERLGVNRHAVREAVNRLQQARLVKVTHGGATRVLDWRATGGLDLLVDLAQDRAERLDPDVMLAIAELRACIGVDAARRCAERGSADLREAAAKLAEEIAGTRDAEVRRTTNVRLWDAIVDGAGNLAYRLGLNSLVAGLADHPDLDVALAPTDDDVPHLRALARALRSGDAASAAAAARPLLERPLATI